MCRALGPATRRALSAVMENSCLLVCGGVLGLGTDDMNHSLFVAWLEGADCEGWGAGLGHGGGGGVAGNRATSDKATGSLYGTVPSRSLPDELTLALSQKEEAHL
jgi:hypothetical protein